MVRNWKTTLAGVAAVLAVAAKVISGQLPDATDIGIIAAAIGLFAAKDKNVTGGTVHQ